MTGRTTPTNRRRPASPSKSRKKTLSGGSIGSIDLKEVIDSARINFRSEIKRSKSSLASPNQPTPAASSPSKTIGSKSNSAPASPVKAANVDSSSMKNSSPPTVTTGSKRRAAAAAASASVSQQLSPPANSGLSPKRAKTERSKHDSSSSSTLSSSPPASEAPTSTVAAPSPGGNSKRATLMPEEKKRKAPPMDEVSKLQMDEGVYHLLHSLQNSRRRTQTTRFNVAPPQKKQTLYGSLSGGSSLLSNSLVTTVRPNAHARNHSPSPSQNNSSATGAAEGSKHKPLTQHQKRQRQRQSEKNHLILFNRANVKATTPEELMTPKTLELLKKLPKKEYVDLWSSTARYKMSDEAMTAAAACSPPMGKASSVSPDSSASSDISSASAMAEAVRRRRRIGDRMLPNVTYINKVYKDILIRSNPCFSQIIMSTNTTGLRQTFNVNVFEEITDAMKLLQEDPSCRAVLLTGLGPTFCQGVDLSMLVIDSVEKQKKSAESLANAIKAFVKFLLGYPKLLIAGVNGSCSGLGLTLLPYFDIVYASDKAMFRTDYPNLRQIPEAFASVALATAPGLSEAVLLSRSFTATQAHSFGLVSHVVWPDRFLEEIVPRIEVLEDVNAPGLQMTKAVLKSRLKRSVAEVMDEETKQLVACWTAPDFAKNTRQYLKNPNCILFQ